MSGGEKERQTNLQMKKSYRRSETTCHPTVIDFNSAEASQNSKLSLH